MISQVKTQLVLRRRVGGRQQGRETLLTCQEKKPVGPNFDYPSYHMRCCNYSSPTHAPRGLPDPNRNSLEQANTIVQVIWNRLIILTLDFMGFIRHTLSSCFHKKRKRSATHTQLQLTVQLYIPKIPHYTRQDKNTFVRDKTYHT